MRGPVVPDLECVSFPSTTFDVTCTVELSFEVPTIEFNGSKIHKQLVNNRHIWIRGVKLDKESLARVLGMESCKFLFAGAFQNVDVNRITITRYDKNGKVAAREEE